MEDLNSGVEVASGSEWLGKQPKKVEEQPKLPGYYLFFRKMDGTINSIVQSSCKLQGWENIEVVEIDAGLAEQIEADIESWIVDLSSQAARRRTEIEIEMRVREIYNRVKSGELHRVPNDLIDRYKHFFTSGELDEVELPEQKIRRLEARLKALETRLR